MQLLSVRGNRLTNSTSVHIIQNLNLNLHRQKDQLILVAIAFKGLKFAGASDEVSTIFTAMHLEMAGNALI